MGRHKGVNKTPGSGRKKGTPNVTAKKLNLIEMLADYGVDYMQSFIDDLKHKDPFSRTDIWAQMMPYIFTKPAVPKEDPNTLTQQNFFTIQKLPGDVAVLGVEPTKPEKS